MNIVREHVSDARLLKRHFTHDAKNAFGTLEEHVSNARLLNRHLLYDKFATVYGSWCSELIQRFFDMVMVFILYSLCLCIFSIYLNKIIFGGFL